LATIQLGASSKPPLFCVPGAGAGAADFVSLAAALGDQHRVRAFQPRGMDGVLAPHSSVEAAARAYLVELLRSAPRGPVDLAGHSFGGWVAFEMARQLEASGRQVASLTLLDSECPLETHRVGREYTRVEALLHLISLYEEASGKKLQISPTSLQAREPEAQIALLHAELIRVGLMPARSSAGALLGPVRTFATALRTQYRPSGTFNGHTRLMLVRRASETELAAQLRFEKVLAHWRVLAPYTEFKVGQGNHVTLLKTPHVRELADWMLVASGNPYESGVRLRVDASALTPARAVSSVRGA
jgi:thioesterase domain-containing protein